MLGDVLRAKLREYRPGDAIEQENVLQEILQHYVLSALSRAGFFSGAVFHGGTCLRIFHGLARFSEDLDFLLKRPDTRFAWERFLDRMVADCALEGLPFEVFDKSRADNPVRKVFLKTDAPGKFLAAEAPFARHGRKKFRVKLEVDTNPPAGSAFETAWLTFPVVAPVTVQSPGSGFSTKLHALLCRRYVKGRDWYDFTWYVSHRIVPDLRLLENALRQQGPWREERVAVSPAWLAEALGKKIASINWQEARDDVQRFLPPGEQPGLQSWSRDFFLFLLRRLADSLAEGNG